MIRRALAPVAIAGALALAACAGPPAPAPTADTSGADAELYAAAQEEGELVFYCAEIQAACDAMAAAFNERYPGVTARMIRLVSAEISTRFEAEKQAGAQTADVILSSDVPFLMSALDSGLTMPWDEADLPGYPGEYPAEWISEEVAAPFEVAVWAIAWNTDAVEDGDAPQSFADLLDPQWKGRIVAHDPSVTAASGVVWGTIADLTGNDEFLEELAGQDIEWVAGGIQPASQAMAAGEADIQAVANLGALQELKDKGAPIDWVFPEESTGPPFSWALNAEAEHPNAARLFAYWVTTREASEVLTAANAGAASAYAAPDGVTVKAPDFAYFQPELNHEILEKLGRPVSN